METEKLKFIERFSEACGTREPSQVGRLLNISYQAAKNYLHGRLPDSTVLKIIAERTPYSIHWLITGEGNKFVSPETQKDVPIFTDQIRALIRHECVEVINEVLGSSEATQPKVVVLQSDKLRSEKVNEPATLSQKQS